MSNRIWGNNLWDPQTVQSRNVLYKLHNCTNIQEMDIISYIFVNFLKKDSPNTSFGFLTDFKKEEVMCHTESFFNCGRIMKIIILLCSKGYAPMVVPLTPGSDDGNPRKSRETP